MPIADMVVKMTVHNARELGAAIRRRRADLGWTQADLATKVGGSRDWVVGIEAGTSNPRFDRLLRTLALLRLDLTVTPTAPPAPGPAAPPSDLDTLLATFRA